MCAKSYKSEIKLKNILKAQRVSTSSGSTFNADRVF